MLGTCSCAVVRCVLCALSGSAAPGGRCCLAPVRVPWLWPAACLSGVPPGPAWCAAPRLVRSLSVLRSAFPTPWCLSPPRGLAPPALLGGCAGHAEAGREPGSLCLPLAPAEAGALGSLRVVPVRGPATGFSLVGPSGVGLGLLALRWLACVDLVTDASGFPYRPSFDGGLGRCTGAVSCGHRHLSLRIGGRHARVPCVCACACSFWPGRAGRPPGRFLGRLTFSFGRLVFLLCLAPSGRGLPLSWLFAFALFFFFFFLVSPLFFPCTPFVSCFLWFLAPGALGLGASCCSFCWPRASWLSVRSSFLCVAWPLASPVVPPPLSLAAVAVPRCLALFFFFLLSAPPLSLAFFVSRPRVPWALALLCVCCALLSLLCVFFFCPPLLGSSCALACFLSPGWPTPSLQMSARTWPIRSVQVQLGNSGPTSMSEPKLRAASGSQEDTVHRRAEQEAPRLTTEASAARGDSLQHLRRRVAASISRSVCPASSSTPTAAGGTEEEGEFRRRINEYILHNEYYKSVTGKDGEEPLDALGSRPYTDMGSYPYSGPPTDLADTVSLPRRPRGPVWRPELPITSRSPEVCPAYVKARHLP